MQTWTAPGILRYYQHINKQYEVHEIPPQNMKH